MKLPYQAATKGVPNTTMAARGKHSELGDDDIRTIVDFMVAAAALPRSTLAAATRYDRWASPTAHSSALMPNSTAG